MATRSIKSRLSRAAMRGLGAPGKGTTRAAAEKGAQSLLDLGIYAVHFNSTDEELAEWADRLWDDENDPLEDRQKEWMQIEYYVANEQFIAYHRGRRGWIMRPVVPGRIRSIYNICGKAVELRVQRLTENKPALSVQAATVDMGDVQKAEYKQTLFWGLWEKLSLHARIVGARTWATLNGSGFLKVGWDPDAGVEIPATRKQVKYEMKDLPVPDPATGQPQLDPATGQPVTAPQQMYAGIEELYIDAQGNELGPVEITVEDEDNPGQTKKVRAPVPDNCDVYNEGEVFVDERSAPNIRWDRYVDDVDESWYVQDSEILPGSKIVAMFPDALEALQEAQAATEEDKLQFAAALAPRDSFAYSASQGSRRSGAGQSTEKDSSRTLDKEYVVRETWIYPINSHIKRMWGRNGAKLTTVGGILVAKSELPEWAKKKRNFIRFIDLPEKRNHYGKANMRDILPLQDDINRSRSMEAERLMLESRLILGAQQNHQMKLSALGGMPGVLVTYRSKEHRPEPIDFGQRGKGTTEFYRGSLEAVNDLGNMNDASTGKIPAAGVPAKAIYALQYADDRSIKKTSTLQDESLKKLAMAIDAVTRVEYKEARKVRISGEDREFLVESEILPDQLDTDIDYFFTPGSMLSTQKEAVRNEMLTLRQAGLIDDATVRKFLAVGTPDVFRRSNDLHEAKARRNLSKILRHDGQAKPDPWDDPIVHIGVIQEYMLTQKWDVTPDEKKQQLVALWQAFKLMVAQQQQAQQQQVPAGKPGQPPAGKPAPAKPRAPGAPGPPPGAPVAPGHPPGMAGARGDNRPTAIGARAIEQAATRAEQPRGS